MMVEGTGPGNATPNQNQPLGNKFFLKTGAQCMDNTSKQLVDRYMYINNVPDGSIPLLTKSTGIEFKDFRGLIPGIMGNLEVMNPLSIFKGFMEGSNPLAPLFVWIPLDNHQLMVRRILTNQEICANMYPIQISQISPRAVFLTS